MAEIAKHILKMIIPEKIEPKDKKILLNLSAHKLKITEKNADIIKTIIQKYAPFELLTAGWVYKTNTKSKIQNSKNVDIDKQKGYWEKSEGKPGEGKLSYLIYRKPEK